MLLLALPAAWFPFVIPWDDTLKGTATDVSFLNAAPAGKNGRIVAKGGHFVEANTGKRVRFMGTNLTALSAFPTHADADKIAGRLAKLGFNIVRFHHLQNSWDLAAGGSIWKKDKPMVEVDPKQLDKLDYFVFALKKKGIYTNLNLQTTRDYLPEMGFPEEVRQLKDFAKKIDKVDRKMIALQKQYAKDLLDRKNPYTGLRYKDDPALAVVEINNENSLVGWPGESPGQGLAEMPPYFRGEVQTAWNAWLKKSYSTDNALRASWAEGVTPDGPSLIKSGNRWTEENQSGGDVTPVGFVVSSDGQRAMPIAREVKSNPGPDWHVQLHQTGLDLEEGGTYTAVFTASCSNPANINVAASLDVDDWHNVGLNRTIRLTPEPKTFRLSFTARGVKKDHNRIAFAIGGARGVVRIEGLQLLPGLGGALLPEGATLGNIPLPDGGTKNQTRDWTRFLAETETAYADEMRAYLRNDLGIKANLIDSQIQWGGLTALQREKDSDFADAHMYWEHPDFPRGAWDPKDWTIRNFSMVKAITNGNEELFRLAQNRVAGKPFTVSEYNHPAPSDYRVEMMPVLASFAAAQDWDGFYTFDYGLTGTGREGNDRVQGFFQTATDPVKAAFFPAAALIFRGGLLPAPKAFNYVTVPADRPWELAKDAGAAWSTTGLSYAAYRVGIKPVSGPPKIDKQLGGWERSMPSFFVDKLGDRGRPGPGMYKPAENDPKGFLYTQKPPPIGAHWSFGAPEKSPVCGTLGFVGGYETGYNGASFAFPQQGNLFAAAVLTALDGKPLASTTRALLTIANRAENPGMAWNKERTTVGDGWGKSPVLAEGVECVVTVPTKTLRRAWALDPQGRRKAKVVASFRNGTLYVKAHPRYKTLWYEFTP